MKRKLYQLTAILLLGALSLSCKPDGAEYVDELDIVYTNYDASFDFNSQTTYSLPNKVVLITDDFIDLNPGDEPDYLDPVAAGYILSAIRLNMNEKGYTEIPSGNSPDLIILPTVAQTDQIYFYYDWWYWNWFYPGWGPGWGWYYPGYYPPQVSRVRTGTLMMQMTAPNQEIVADKIPVIWTGLVNGLLEGSAGSIKNRVDASIDQAFEQSPYLAK
ncbi:DUF4136 domain-containing protein [Algoriphagus machipongonensis]|uniref:DUF4136 domain-containing protein n=1 Tax=Algoriphagus machipongonensis TaxID=388413 RepID=A3I1T5_9BACT|nr:DUF4136 domain-containing protein [Algoriphagus machipongonensis]EAZ79751.1 hypothetical protein ALPR1_09003 [Algoriphagus machipongonensis]